MKKVSIIGSGNVGATAAMIIAKEQLADVFLLDIVEGIPQGKSIDLSQSMALFESKSQITGTNDYGDLAGSDVIVVTAGLPRKPGMTRSDLLKKNAGIVEAVVSEIIEESPQSILLIVTNPLDVMTHLAHKKSGFPKERVFGMGGLLDSARMRYFLSRLAEVEIDEVEATVIGAHGDAMVPLLSLSKIKGRMATEILEAEALNMVKNKTVGGGAEIVAHLKSGSAFYAPGASVATMVRAILNDTKETISTCCLTSGEYGLNDLYINLPAVIGAGGVEDIIELNISEEEKMSLIQSSKTIEAALAEISA